MVLNRLRRRTLVLIFVSLAVSGSLSGINTRQAAPKFVAKSMDGERFTNENLKGQVVLLQFWTTWCRYCRGDQDAVESIANDFAGKGLTILAVNVGESKKKVNQYLASSPRSCKIVLAEDTNLAAIFVANSYPLYVVIDREGKVVDIQRGAGGEESLRDLLKKAGLAKD